MIVFVIIYINKQNKDLEFFSTEIKRLTSNNGILDENNLKHFSYNIHYDPPKETIIIKNKYKCTPDKPKLCSLNDSTSCAGCQNLLSICVHIDKSVKYVDKNGNSGFLTANKEGEGYCLDILSANQRCNPYHGELVLVMVNTYSSMFICNCKNPGIVGNITIDGPCETPFICNGNIENINVPADKLKCVCEYPQKHAQVTDKFGNIYPVCKNTTILDLTTERVKELAKINGFTEEDDLISVSLINPIYSANIKTELVPNPCKIDLLSGRKISGKLHVQYDKNNKPINAQCYSNTLQCFPVRRWNDDARYLIGPRGPDGMISLFISGFLNFGTSFSDEYTKGQALSIVADVKYLADVWKVTFEQLQHLLNVQTINSVMYLTINANNEELTWPFSLQKLYKYDNSVFYSPSCDITITEVSCKYDNTTESKLRDQGKFNSSVADRVTELDLPDLVENANKMKIIRYTNNGFNVHSFGDWRLAEWFWQQAPFSVHQNFDNGKRVWTGYFGTNTICDDGINRNAAAIHMVYAGLDSPQNQLQSMGIVDKESGFTDESGFKRSCKVYKELLQVENLKDPS